MTKPAPPKAYSNAPPWSIKIWTYPRTWPPTDIYCEIASGLIQKFSLTEGGLTKILKLIQLEARSQSPLANGKSKGKSPVPIKRTRPKAKPASDIPEDQLDRIGDFLKKTGRI